MTAFGDLRPHRALSGYAFAQLPFGGEPSEK
jgi:hypothetical protein